jgi:hypothetical protein
MLLFVKKYFYDISKFVDIWLSSELVEFSSIQ